MDVNNDESNRHSSNERSKEGLKQLLCSDLKNRLIPVFINEGFEVFTLTPEEQKSPEMRTAFPLGRLKRWKDKQLEIVELQFDRCGKAKFVINFGVAPEEGVTLPWTHIDQEYADVSSLSEAYRLFSNSVWTGWFEIGWLLKKNETNIKLIVNQAIALIPEIEIWFSTGAVGKHMRKFGFTQ